MRHPLSPAIDTEGRITLTSKISAAIFVLGIPSLAVILGAWLLCMGRVSALDLWILIGSYVATALGITAGFHRLFTHRSFETYRPIRWVLAILGSTAAQGGVLVWSAQHRQHHASSDSPGDPHSPKLGGLLHSHYFHIFRQVERIDPERFVPDLIRDPFLRWLERNAVLGVLLGLAAPAAAGWAIGGTWQAAATGFLWGGLIRLWIVNMATGAVNSICHRFGSRPFDTGDDSGNVWWLMPVALGENWHAGHHSFPSSARHGLRWWEIDPTWIVIWLLEKTGLCWNVIRIPKNRWQQKLRA